MKRPNKSGGIVRLSGKRRRPYAARIWNGVKINDKGVAVPQYKYIGYYEKMAEAMSALEKYNQSPVELAKEKELKQGHTFSEIYDMWIEELNRRSKPLSRNTFYSYQAAYKKLKPLHNMVFEKIVLEDLESQALKFKDMSLSSITNIQIVLKGMYKTAMRHKYVSEDISALLILEHNTEKVRPHINFTDDEIDVLWANKDNYYAKAILILIYTGMRVRELLNVKSDDVDLDERYLVGGLKTDAGKNRQIPLSDKIIPLLDTSNSYLISYKGKKMSYDVLKHKTTQYLASLGINHSFHDTRHTCATLMERANISSLHRKLILGHKINDITDGVYTHVPIKDLVNDINKI